MGRFDYDRIKYFKGLGFRVDDLKDKVSINRVVLLYKDGLELIDVVKNKTLKFKTYSEGEEKAIQLAVEYKNISDSEVHILTGKEHKIVQNDKVKSEDHLYFIKAMGYIKIGRSKHPRKRLSSLSVSWPEQGKILGVIWNKGHLEKDIHECFSGIRISQNKEWFYNDPRLTTFISERCFKPNYK